MWRVLVLNVPEEGACGSSVKERMSKKDSDSRTDREAEENMQKKTYIKITNINF